MKLSSIISPQIPIGGLEIGETSARYFLMQGGAMRTASVEIPEGVIRNGKVADREKLGAVLRVLHRKIMRNAREKLYVIFSLPDSDAYVQVFSIPPVGKKEFESTARLNLQMVSPIDFHEAYCDWEQVGGVALDGVRQVEILGAFAQKAVVNPFLSALEEARFAVVAVEFQSLSLARLMQGDRIALPPKNSFALLRADAAGTTFSIIRNNALYFTHFSPWNETGYQITLASLRQHVVDETRKILNFALSQWSDEVKDMVLVAPSLQGEISSVLQDSFSLKVRPVAPRDLKQFSALPNAQALTPEWLTVIGAAYRGAIPRRRDAIVSLMEVGTEEEFERAQTIAFVRIWRDVLFSVGAAVVIAFALFDGFARYVEQGLTDQLANFRNSAAVAELGALQKQAEKFNRYVDAATEAKRQSADFIPLLVRIQNMAGKDIAIDRIYVQGAGIPAVVNARAASNDAIIAFKEALEKDASFSNVNLPLSEIVSAEGPMIRFTISFNMNTQNIQ